ncbi:tautomerase family protein, partial [Clostridium neonatale]
IKGDISMPFVNVKVIENQITLEKKKELVAELTDLIVKVMGREREYTVITIDELKEYQWAIGGVTLDESSNKEIAVFVNIKVSKGTTNPDEMNIMIKAIKELIVRVLGNSAITNYVVIDELNPDGWGFDGISMTERNKMEQ